MDADEFLDLEYDDISDAALKLCEAAEILARLNERKMVKTICSITDCLARKMLDVTALRHNG